MNLWFLAPELLAEIEISKDLKGVYRVCSHPSDKPKRANPEEIIRQLVLVQLRCHYHYPHDRLIQEYVVQMGVTKKRADIAIINSQNNLESLIEVKQIIDDDSILQLQSYMLATGTRFGAVVSLHTRKVFMRDQCGSFTQISDLPVFQRETDSNGATIESQQYSVLNSAAKTLMATLGVTGITRISNSISHLHIKNKILRLSNTNLLNYNTVRKQAIQEGIILPSTVGNSAWDELLSLLFDNAAEIEVPTTSGTRGEESFCTFLDQFCEQCSTNTEIKFKEIYNAYAKWHKENIDDSDKYLPSKKNISAQLLKNGFQRRNSGGQVFISGIRIR
jgi:hypothetical protein